MKFIFLIKLTEINDNFNFKISNFKNSYFPLRFNFITISQINPYNFSAI